MDTPSSSEEEEEAEEGEGERKCFLVRTIVCFVLFCLDAVCVIGVAAVDIVRCAAAVDVSVTP